jgi:hypothetical protein
MTSGALDLRTPLRHRLCRRDPLPALYRRAARIVAEWRAAGLEVLILGSGSPRAARLDDLPRIGAVMAIDLTDEPRVVWEVARRLRRPDFGPID